MESRQSQGKSGVPVTISLREKGDFCRVQSSDFNERVDDCGNFLGVTGAEINNVAIRRVIS